MEQYQLIFQQELRAVIGFKDYADNFDTHALTLVQNGSDKIGGSTINATLQTEGLAVTLVFIDSTKVG